MKQGAQLQPLRAVIEELLVCSQQLHETLLAERDALTQHNLNTLNGHTAAKKELLVHLEALEMRRRGQLNQLGLDPGGETIVPELESLWQNVLEVLRRCQEANEVNGAILRTHQTQTQRALDLLAGQDSNQSVYEADGHRAVRLSSGEIAKA
jgi:flagella synthesis protein FlgN